VNDKIPSTTPPDRKQTNPSRRRLQPDVEPEQRIRDYAHVKPGIYTAFSRATRIYFDPGYKRWTILILFDLLCPDSGETLAKDVPCWLSLGSGEKPCATRRSKYFSFWIAANGEPPRRKERMSAKVFRHRMARVRVADTKGPAPYSRISVIESWETAANNGSSTGLP
jgi:hypothetical protein